VGEFDPATSGGFWAAAGDVPPLFGFATFDEVANNYGGAGRSFKLLAQRLQTTARTIADGFLHGPIRKTESLPNDRQVDLSVEVDALLGEVVRLLSDGLRPSQTP